MNRQKVWLEAKARNFEETPNGVRWEAVIYSSEFNRNKYFFDIYKMNRWQKKLEKILLNDNHEGKYFSNNTDRIVDFKIETDENGITECFAVVESTNEEKKNNPDIVTGFSIELMVDGKDVIANENGEYYIDYEWVGLAYLTGILAGSGDSRVLSTKTFSQVQSNNHMTEEQVKEMLESQKKELQAEFAEQTEQIKKEFAEELVAKSQVKTDGSYSWVGSDGKTYTEKWQNISSSIVTALSEDEADEPQVMEFLANKFGYKKFNDGEDGSDNGEDPKTDPKPESNPTEDPEPAVDDELSKIENQLNHSQNLQNKMKTFRTDEDPVDRSNGANEPAEAKVVDFNHSIEDQVRNNISNVI